MGQRQTRLRAVRVLVTALLVAGLGGCFNRVDVDLGLTSGADDWAEVVVQGEGGPKIALLDVAGLIVDARRPGPLGLSPRPGTTELLQAQLDLAADDPEVQAAVLRIQSPGGTVSASETLHHELQRWKATTGRPIIAYLNGLATSGAYYTAMAADEVVAHPTSVTGSIGVVMPGVNLAGLLERFGVSDQTLASGAFKDSGSSLREMRPEEREQLQGIVDDLHQRFVEVVDRGRPALDARRVEQLADGRIYTARQALEAGLVDSLGYVQDGVDRARTRAGAGQVRVVVYRRDAEPAANLHSAPAVVPSRSLALQPGFYYVWAGALGP